MRIILCWCFSSPPEHSFTIKQGKKEQYFMPLQAKDKYNTGGWFIYGTWGTWTRIKL